MMNIYFLSILAGCFLGAGHGIIFFRNNIPQEEKQQHFFLGGIWLFLVRYVLLFAALLFLCSVVHLNLYLVVLFFFLAFWGYIILKVMGKL